MQQRYKNVLEGNTFIKINQELIIQGLPGPVMVLSRDAITVEMNKVDLADKTQVPGGRNNAGEFNATIQLADDSTREGFLEWYRGSQDSGRGISPNYKRDGMIRYRRLFEGTPAAEYQGAGKAGRPFILKMKGLWVRSMEFPEFDMSGGDEGDSDAALQVTICFDDAFSDPNNLAGAIGGLFGTGMDTLTQRR